MKDIALGIVGVFVLLVLAALASGVVEMIASPWLFLLLGVPLFAGISLF